MLQFGLIGKKLAHSFSPAYFAKKFSDLNLDASYQLYELDDITQFFNLVESHDFTGLNVTVPYKREVLTLIDEPDESALITGAVNTILFRKGNGKQILRGFNTDYPAFRETLRPHIANRRKALIIGNGGAAAAVKAAFNDLRISYLVVNRREDVGVMPYEKLTGDIIKECLIIVNCTPLGMYPATETYPEIPFQYITHKHLVYDLVYNPEETKFLSLAKENGAQIMNGLPMLRLQADLAWEIWMSEIRKSL